MTDKEYHELNAISQSSLKTFIENRKLYEYCYVLGLGTSKSSKAMDLGSVNHTLIFEPEEFHNRYAYFEGQLPTASANMQKFYELVFADEVAMTKEDAYCNCYSTKGKKAEQIKTLATDLYHSLLPYYKFQKEHGGKELLAPDDERVARGMVEVLYQHEGVRKTLLAGRCSNTYQFFKELVITTTLPHLSKRLLKGKIDEMHLDLENQVVYAYDYKTTRAKNTDSFKGSARFYGYDIQESFYVVLIKDWVKRNFNVDVRVIFRFIPQLNVVPYNVLDVVEFEESDREYAYTKWSEALKELDACLDSGQFDNPAAYTDSGIHRMSLHGDSQLVVIEDGGF